MMQTPDFIHTLPWKECILYERFYAHRGLSTLTPENTLPAFAAAIALEADEIEFDVRLTKDGRMIVSHDDWLHAEGIRCNLFFADTPEDYQKYFEMGVDTLPTNRMDLAAHYRQMG